MKAPSEVPGRLDEISEAIGGLRAEVRQLSDRGVERDRTVERNHAENQAQIGSVKVMIGDATERLNTKINDLQLTIERHNTAIGVIEPQVAALQSTKKKLYAYAGIGMAVLAGIGVAAEALLKAAATWMFTKFGG